MIDDTPEFWEGADDDVLDAFGAIPAEYRPRVGDPVPLTVVFRETRGVKPVNAPGLARQERVGSKSFTARGSRHVLADAREGENLVVRGQTYSISNMSFEGVGLVLLNLQGPIV